MPTKIEITGYTLEELKEANPKAFDRVLDNLRDRLDYIPCSNEIMNSLKAVVKACGANLNDWSIGVDGGRCDVAVEDKYDPNDDDNWVVKDASWFLREILQPLGYINDKGEPYFPGLCKLTGYCADDDFMEALNKKMQEGYSLTKSLEHLATVASEMMEQEDENNRSEENLLEMYCDFLYTIDGKRIPV